MIVNALHKYISYVTQKKSIKIKMFKNLNVWMYCVYLKSDIIYKSVFKES